MRLCIDYKPGSERVEAALVPGSLAPATGSAVATTKFSWFSGGACGLPRVWCCNSEIRSGIPAQAGLK